MRVLWFTWKDDKHPAAGGAELVTSEIIQRLLRDGHEVKMITAQYSGAPAHEIRPDGLEIFRGGNRVSVYAAARKIHGRHTHDWADCIVDEMNTIPFLPHTKSVATRVLFNHQLAREVWFYQMRFPLSVVGYVLEPIMLRAICHFHDKKIAVSNSTKHDLERHGFSDIQIIREGIKLTPLKKLPVQKDMFHILALGAIRPMKRTLHAVKAFEIARDTNKKLHMTIAGDVSGKYAETVLRYIAHSRHTKAITVRGRVPDAEKTRLMQETTAILVAPIKEGWGLTVTEANSQGTPAIGYDVDGLRDSIRDNETGLLCRNGDYNDMAAKINMLVTNTTLYQKLRKTAWQWSKEFNFENSYQDFINIVADLAHRPD